MVEQGNGRAARALPTSRSGHGKPSETPLDEPRNKVLS